MTLSPQELLSLTEEQKDRVAAVVKQFAGLAENWKLEKEIDGTLLIWNNNGGLPIAFRLDGSDDEFIFEV